MSIKASSKLSTSTDTSKNKIIQYSGIYLSKYIETNLRDWCKITQESYGAVNKRFNRIMANCPYTKDSRVAYYRQYAFFKAINQKQSFDKLVLYSVEDFLSRISWVLKGVFDIKIPGRKLIQYKKNKVNYQLAKGKVLSEILEGLTEDYDLELTPEQLTKFKQEFTLDKEKYKTLNLLALESGQSPKLVHSRIYEKKWGLNKALNTVSY